MNLRQPPLSAELGLRGVVWLKTTLISHLSTGETFKHIDKKKIDRRKCTRAGFAVESVVIGCHFSSAITESEN